MPAKKGKRKKPVNLSPPDDPFLIIADAITEGFAKLCDVLEQSVERSEGEGPIKPLEQQTAPEPAPQTVPTQEPLA